MSWQPLARFRDRSVPKLNNLRRAAAARIRVPATVWCRAESAVYSPPTELGPAPWIIRSGSPTEDTRVTSNAGQLLSLVVPTASEFSAAMARVVAALPDRQGKKLGAVFVQSLVVGREAGVAFCDGFYFERTQSAGSNEALTSGHARGEVIRGGLERDDPWSQWLRAVYEVFADDRRIDIEFSRDDAGFILLQSRPALFPIRRNPLLSLTNHKEILGDPPSPWITSALAAAGRDLSFMSIPDRRIRAWDETYAIEAGERAWMNFSFWFRWMDHFGLPRTMVTKNFGGTVSTPGDSRILWRPFLRSIPALFRFQFACLATLPRLPREFRRFDRLIGNASSLGELHAATAYGLALALRANFAINAALAGILKVRQFLRIPGAARVVTQDMMNDYRNLAGLPPEARDGALDRWLVQYGHRGPLESDPKRPRFGELRDLLRRDLDSMTVADPGQAAHRSSWLFRIFFLVDERREWFRDQLMRRWARIRLMILKEARRLVDQGLIDSVDDVFWLRESEMASPASYRANVAAAKNRHAAIERIPLPLTATADEIHSRLAAADQSDESASDRRHFPGIALSTAIVEGVARKADDLMSLLAAGGLNSSTILVVPTLEPSWAVVFPRVGGVVADVGGELSHASILLREARRPALVNCTGIYAQVRDGERLRLDGVHGRVERLDLPS